MPTTTLRFGPGENLRDLSPLEVFSRAIERMALEPLVQQGAILNWRWQHEQYQDAFILRVEYVALREQPGRYSQWMISGHEIYMARDGLEGFLRHWAERIRVGCLRYAGMRADPPMVVPRYQGLEGTSYGIDEAAPLTATQVRAMTDLWARDAPQLTDTAFREILQGIPPEWFKTQGDGKAEKKARALFKLVAGEKAYAALDKHKPIPLIGSLGTKYHLHNRSSYCITRDADKAELCAVVPGVPLWDHLLGIKLMVENDEPKFLKTANISGGDRVGYMDTTGFRFHEGAQAVNFNIRPGAVNWVRDDWVV